MSHVNLIELKPMWHLGKITYPLVVYVFNAQGFHAGGQWAANEQELRRLLDGPVLRAVNQAREVRIADDADNMVWWVKDGRVQNQ